MLEPTPTRKISVNIGNLPQVGVNIKNIYIWNHHLPIDLLLQFGSQCFLFFLKQRKNSRPNTPRKKLTFRCWKWTVGKQLFPLGAFRHFLSFFPGPNCYISGRLHPRKLTGIPKLMVLKKSLPWKKMQMFDIYVRFVGIPPTVSKNQTSPIPTTWLAPTIVTRSRWIFSPLIFGH